MTILLLFISPSGSTEKLSCALRDRLSNDGHRVELLNIGRHGSVAAECLGPDTFRDVDVVGVGSPVFHLRALSPLLNVLEAAVPLMRPDVRSFVYLTYGGICSGKAFLNIARRLHRGGIPLVGGLKVWAPHFYKHVEYPDASVLGTVDVFCSRLHAQGFAPLSWRATRRLASYRRSIGRTALVSGALATIGYAVAPIVGRLRELPIRIDTKACIRCRRCCNECPTAAMTMGEYPVYDRRRCIHCYHCVVACPSKAVVSPVERIEDMVRANIRLLGMEEPRDAVLL